MKNAIFFILFSCFFFVACEKTPERIKKEITIELTANPNMALASVQCMPIDKGWKFIGGGGWLTGQVNEIGSLVKEESPYKMISCGFGPERNQITEKAIIRMGRSSTEYLDVEGTFILTFNPNSFPGFEGSVVIKGGTGKFLGAIGSINIDPASVAVDQYGRLSWAGSGIITYDRYEDETEN